MAEANLSILVQLKDEATAQLNTFKGILEQTTISMRQLGIEAGIAGAAIMAGLGVSVKSAEDQLQSQQRLSIAMGNVGVSYDKVKDSLDSVIKSGVAYTNFGVTEQRDALNQLVFTTGNYQTALSLLPEALDLAAGKNIDLSTAALLLGRVNDGNIGRLAYMGIQLSEHAKAAAKAGDSSLALAEIWDKVRGAADATASPFTVFKNNIELLMGDIGSALLPLLKSIVDNIVPIIQKIGDWAAAHPALTQAILVTSGVIGTLLIVLSGLVLIAPSVVASLTLMGVSATTSAAAFTTLLPILLTVAAAIAVFVAAYAGITATGLPNLVGNLADRAWGVPTTPETLTPYAQGILANQAPSFAYGGVVPGPIGQPVPVIAHGGEMFLGANGGGNTIYNVTVQGSVLTENELWSQMRSLGLTEKKRNTTTGF